MKKTAQQSLLDMLLQIMPALQNVKNNNLGKNDKTGDFLYSLWNNSGKTANRKFEKPSNLPNADITKMISAGLIEEHGKYIKITEKAQPHLR
jgi:hypothetical protein